MLWLGTWEGLNYFNPKTRTCIRYFSDPDEVNIEDENAILTMLPEGNSSLQIGTVKYGLNTQILKPGSLPITDMSSGGI